MQLGIVVNLDAAQMGQQGSVVAMVFFLLNLVHLPQSANHVFELGLSNGGDGLQV